MSAAKDLKLSLTQGEGEPQETHTRLRQEYGLHYIQWCQEVDERCLRMTSMQIFENAALALHILSAEHVSLKKANFTTLYRESEFRWKVALYQLI